MIITCQNCECRFRVDETKAPSGNFTVACPKCQHRASASTTSDSRESSATAVGASPSTSHPRFQRATPAPLFRGSERDEPGHEEFQATPHGANDLAMSLLALLKPEKSDRAALVRSSWDRRRALVCT